MPAGRPTSYKEEYCDEIIEYFDKEPWEEKEIIKTYKDGTESVEYVRQPIEMPTLAGFARLIGVHRDTVHEWTKHHDKFSDALKRAKDCQERILVANGLNGLYATAFAIFTAKNVINWRDRQEIGLNGTVDVNYGIGFSRNKLPASKDD